MSNIESIFNIPNQNNCIMVIFSPSQDIFMEFFLKHDILGLFFQTKFLYGILSEPRHFYVFFSKPIFLWHSSHTKASSLLHQGLCVNLAVTWKSEPLEETQPGFLYNVHRIVQEICNVHRIVQSDIYNSEWWVRTYYATNH